MLRIFIMLIATLSLTISCARPKKQDQGDTAAGSAPDANVDDRAIGFDAQGSDSGNINGLNTIFFEYDKAHLTSDAQQTLRNNADWIKKNGRATVQIEGHSDERGSIEYNLSLGERRARSVKNYLVGLGVDANRLTIISYGEEKPLVSESTEAAWARNRRANFVPMAQ